MFWWTGHHTINKIIHSDFEIKNAVKWRYTDAGFAPI